MAAVERAEDIVNWRPVLAGLCATLVGIGLARFAYTPLIPALISAHWFSPSATVYLGAANLAGYLGGALLARPIAARAEQLRLRWMMVAASAAFFACAFPLSFGWLFLWRFASGVSGGALMALAAPVVLPHIKPSRRGLASGAIFTGVGLGIAASGTLVPLLMRAGLAQTWFGLGAVALLLTLISWGGWPHEQLPEFHQPSAPPNPGSGLVALYVARSTRSSSSCGRPRIPTRPYGFVNAVVNVTDLSSSIWMWHLTDGEWQVTKIIDIPAEPADAADLPPLLAGFGAVPPLVTDIDLSLDDRFLYVSCFGTGELRQYDVSDPWHPTLTGSVRIGGIVARASHPAADGPLNGGPQMVEVSRDGRRVYLANSLYRAWDEQFYPDGIKPWMVKLDVGRRRPTFDERFFPTGFGNHRVHQVHLEGGDASSDSYCFP